MKDKEIIINGYNAFCYALDKGLIEVEKIDVNENIYFHFDVPAENVLRFTYVKLGEQKNVISFCAFALTEIEMNNTAFWHIGWVVNEKHRNSGEGYDLISKALPNFLKQDAVKKLARFHNIQASVNQNNLGSIKLAEKILGNRKLMDNSSLNFMKFFDTI